MGMFDGLPISPDKTIAWRDEGIASFVSQSKRNYIVGRICGVASNTSIKDLVDMKSINLFGEQQICRNSIGPEAALAAIPSIVSESVQQRLDCVQTFYELLNMPYEERIGRIYHEARICSLLPNEYANLWKVQAPGEDIPPDPQDRVSAVGMQTYGRSNSLEKISRLFPKIEYRQYCPVNQFTDLT